MQKTSPSTCPRMMLLPIVLNDHDTLRLFLCWLASANAGILSAVGFCNVTLTKWVVEVSKGTKLACSRTLLAALVELNLPNVAWKHVQHMPAPASQADHSSEFFHATHTIACPSLRGIEEAVRVCICVCGTSLVVSGVPFPAAVCTD